MRRWGIRSRWGVASLIKRSDLDTLDAFKTVSDVNVYGFCLMTNHVHLILQPGEAIAGLGQLMKRLAGRRTRFVNRQKSWSGMLFSAPFSAG